MKIISNQNIGVRLGLVFATILALATAVVIIGITRLAEVTSSLELIGTDRVPKVEVVVEITDKVNLIARELRNTLIFEDRKAVNEAINIAQTAGHDIDKEFDYLVDTIKSSEGIKRIGAALRARDSYIPKQQDFIELILSGRHDAAAELLAGELRPAQLSYMSSLDSLKNLQVGLITLAVDEGHAVYVKSRFIITSLLGIMAAIGVILSFIISRSITRPINQAVAIAEKVAAGDLSSNISIESTDETGRLLSALKDMNQSLINIVSTVRRSSETIAIGSTQIAKGNLDLSQRTEEQASSLKNTAASMNELGETVKQNATNANQANQLAQGASTVALAGGEVVDQVVNTMRGINDSSHRIADIITVIDTIAFQTNLLALNAAVEAARAGEHGRGFAVVASEVRSLAHNSSEAATQIKQLINDSVETVGKGTELVDQAGATMSEIVSSINQVTEIVSEISHASSEQSTGVTRVGQAITTMDDVTQQNTKLVEQSSSSAGILSTQASQLVQSVAFFKLGAHDVPAINSAHSVDDENSVALNKIRKAS